MKLGIVVVYLLRDNGRPLLDLHLDRIARHTPQPYTIFGAPLRLPATMNEHLRARPEVRMVDTPPFEGTGISQEHSWHLDHLVDAAMAEGVTHLCALHVDSFPVRDGWLEDLAGGLDERCVAAAILRAENGDTTLPFPAGLLWTAAFQKSARPRFLQTPDVVQSQAYQQVARGVGTETGSGYAFTMHQNGVTWKKMLRSNRRSDHYMIASIYGDTFFHLGAAARDDRHFRGDIKGGGRSTTQRVRQWLLNWAEQHLPEGASKALRRAWPGMDAGDLAKAEERNRLSFEQIFEKLLADPDGYIAWLRGKPR